MLWLSLLSRVVVVVVVVVIIVAIMIGGVVAVVVAVIIGRSGCHYCRSCCCSCYCGSRREETFSRASDAGRKGTIRRQYLVTGPL